MFRVGAHYAGFTHGRIPAGVEPLGNFRLRVGPLGMRDAHHGWLSLQPLVRPPHPPPTCRMDLMQFVQDMIAT